MGIERVDRLGAEIERRWHALEHDPHRFAEVAAAALGEAELTRHLTPDEIVWWCLGAPTLPRQESMPARFGQPPITLFRERRFYIEALFWLDGTTSIHQHAFSGAFQVLAGSSIETRYAFEVERALGGQLALGQLRTISTALLNAGDVRPIASGMGGLIHALFHLERPSVTVVVRTFRDPDAGPQLNYARPGVGHDPFYKEDGLDRTLELVTMLFRSEHPAADEKLGELVARSDLHAAYRILLEASAHADRGRLERLVDSVRDRAVAAVFRAALDENRRIRFLQGRRNVVKETELRFFLGVLLNAHRLEDVMTLVRARVPDRDPAGQIAAWVRRLANTTMKLQAAGEAWQPSVLGLPEMNDALEHALARSLAGGPPASDASEARFLAALRDIPSLAGLFG
jgi:hypothetical protein